MTTLNPSKTGKGVGLWARYIKAEARAEHAPSSYSSAERKALWESANKLYLAWRKAEGLPLQEADEE